MKQNKAFPSNPRYVHRVGVIAAAALVAAVGAPAFGFGDHHPMPTTDERVVLTSSSGAEVVITNNGDCANVSVEVHTPLRPATFSSVTSAKYIVDRDCRVSLVGDRGAAESVDHLAGSATPIGSVRVEPEPPDADRRATNGDDAHVASGTWYGNYIHSSSTLQDIITIDIAWLRYHTDRKWNGTVTQFKADRFTTAGAPRSWNHVRWHQESWAESGQAAWRQAKATGAYHSDFLWCNFQPGQSFFMRNYNKTYFFGAATATFTQSRTCSGTHMATDHWTSTSRNG